MEILFLGINFKDTNYPELAIYDIEWKRIDGTSLEEDLFDVNKSENTQSILQISELTPEHAGKFACYVFASTGTIRQAFELKQKGPSDMEIIFNEPSKRINLTIEKIEKFDNYNGISQQNDLIFGDKYQFDCITGKHQKRQKFYIAKNYYDF